MSPSTANQRSRLRWLDVADEALAGITRRPARAAFTAFGTTLGVGSFVAVLGLTTTASSQIGERFNALTATEVRVTDARDPSLPLQPTEAFPADADERANALNGVTAAGVAWQPQAAEQALRGAQIAGSHPVEATVVAASPGYLSAAGLQFVSGRAWDAYHEREAAPVVLLASAVAKRLNVAPLETRPAIFIGDRPFQVIGVYDDVVRDPNLLLAAVVPRRTAEAMWGQPTPDDSAGMLIATDLGAARQVATEVAVALKPSATETLAVTAPPDPRTLRERVSTDLSTLFLILSCVCLGIGAIGIANTTLVAVIERIPEFGLRRSLGARPRHIATHVLTESALLGGLGGLTGASGGVLVVVAASAAKHWSAVLEPLTLAAAPVVGVLTGLLAGLYPAWRAARIEPSAALRR